MTPTTNNPANTSTNLEDHQDMTSQIQIASTCSSPEACLFSPFELELNSSILFDNSPAILSPSIRSPLLLNSNSQQQQHFEGFTHLLDQVNNEDANVDVIMASSTESSHEYFDHNAFAFIGDFDMVPIEQAKHDNKALWRINPPVLTMPVEEQTDRIISKKFPIVMEKDTGEIAREKSSPIRTATNSRNNERGWITVFVDEQFGKDIKTELKSKTRCENACDEVPEKMYSSLKYEIRHHATGGLCSEVAFLLSRITVVDSVTSEEIKKGNKPMLKGVIESALTKQPGNSTDDLYGVLKCQFTDVSYHHNKKNFCWQVSLYRPEDLDNPIMIKRSAPFQVFARKPAANKKRRRENPELDEFQSRVDELFKDTKKMKADNKRKILEIVCRKMFDLDGKLFIEKVAEMQNQTCEDGTFD